MVKLSSKKNELVRSVLVGLAFAALGAIFQFSSSFVANLIKKDVTFVQRSSSEWIGDVSRLAEGHYYVSVGRPRTGCDLFLNEALVDSNRSSRPEIRSGLMLGASFYKDSASSAISVRCLPQAGFGPRLTHEPIVASFRIGIFLQLWRTFSEVLIGPLVSIFLLLTVLLQVRSTTHVEQRSVTLAPHLVFGVSAFLYSISLAYYPMLFIDGASVVFFHIFCRNFFSIALILLVGSYSKTRKDLIALHFVAIAISTFLFYTNFSNLNLFYKWSYIIFPVSTLLATLELFKKEDRTRSIVLLKPMGIAWTLVQTVDLFSLWKPVGIYAAPATLVMMACMTTYIKYYEKLRNERIEVATARILAVIEAKSPIREILAQLATIVVGETRFSRVSAYVDGFCIGLCDRPFRTFARVMENGYRKNTAKDLTIEIGNDRGMHMISAMEQNSLLLRQGVNDKAWFIVVPIGRMACLNLSNDSPSSPYTAYESEEILRRLMPALSTLAGRLEDSAYRNSHALEKLRSIKGDGKWEDEIGVMFVDINEYSSMTDRFGHSFADFVSATYFPSLIKVLGKFAVPEFVRGDEIYFVSIRELIADGYQPSSATISAISMTQSFILNEGRALCLENGFPPIQMSVGANVGTATIICDPIKVRTTGQTVNEAKRLQEAAGTGKCLIKSETYDKHFLESVNLHIGEEIPILVKKNLIMARTLKLATLAEEGTAA